MTDKHTTVADAVKILQTLEQDAILLVGDSEYPACDFSLESISKISDGVYMVY